MAEQLLNRAAAGLHEDQGLPSPDTSGRITGMHRRTFIGTMAFALLGGRRLAARQGESRTWTVAGDTRRAIVFAPPWGGQTPAVFAFHGHGDNIESFQRTNLQEAWPEALVVYVQGLPTRRSGLPGWQVTKGQDDDRDLRLVDTALASLGKSYQIDEARVYATGFSNGAGFTYLLWAERPDVFAAFAPVSGRLGMGVELREPKPVLAIGGKEDRGYADQLAAIEAAKQANRTAAPVRTWLHPGGHEWRGGSSDRIASFFRGQRKPKGPLSRS